MCSSGDKAEESLFLEIENYNDCVVVVEEPENHLNPIRHKNIHKRLSEIAASNNIVFFIATHSPYIISAAVGDSSTNVYCLKDGKLIINPRYWTTNKPEYLSDSSSGFLPSECKSLVHHILGSNLGDFLPKIVFCESSLEELVKSFCENKNKTHSFSFMGVGGDSQILNFTKKENKILSTISEFNEHKQIMKCYGIIDFISPSQIGEVKQLNEIEDKNPDTIFQLKEDELEKLYPENLVNNFFKCRNYDFEWKNDGKKFKDFINHNIEFKDNDNLGKFKSELAQFIGNEIPEEDFKNIFPPKFLKILDLQ